MTATATAAEEFRTRRRGSIRRPVYRVDPDAKTVWEMVPNFGHSEIVALLDYYVGLRHFQNENLTGIALYALEEC